MNGETHSPSKTTKKVRCTCEHDYQDQRYGKQIRIANMKKGGSKWTCTVCAKEHS